LIAMAMQVAVGAARPAEPDDEEGRSGRQLQGNQPDGSRLVPGGREHGLGQPLMVGPDLSGSGVGIRISPRHAARPPDVLPEADVAPEVGIGEGRREQEEEACDGQHQQRPRVPVRL